MPSFVCDVCQDTVKKPKLDQHLLRCPHAVFSCVDCSTTFVGTSYRDHTSCVSEAEKYQKALFKPKGVKGASTSAVKAAPSAGATAAGPAKARPPKEARKKAYWEESTTDESGDERPAPKAKAAAVPAAKAAAVPAAKAAAVPAAKAAAVPAAKAAAVPAAKAPAAKAAAPATKSAAPEAKTAPAPPLKRARTDEDDTVEERKPKKGKSKKDALAEASDGLAADVELAAAAVAPAPAAHEEPAAHPVSIAELVAALQLGHAIRSAALEVVQSRATDEEPVSLQALEAAIVKRLQWAGCTLAKKELRATVKKELTVGLDTTGTRLVLSV